MARAHSSRHQSTHRFCSVIDCFDYPMLSDGWEIAARGGDCATCHATCTQVPYSCECRIEAFKEAEELIRIRAVIYVSHESQKGIVIGKKGAALKKVGIASRKRLEDFFQKQVYLETRVKVRPNWRQDLKSLEEFGYV